MSMPRDHQSAAADGDDDLGLSWRSLVEEEYVPADELELPAPTGWIVSTVEESPSDRTGGHSDS